MLQGACVAKCKSYKLHMLQRERNLRKLDFRNLSLYLLPARQCILSRRSTIYSVITLIRNIHGYVGDELAQGDRDLRLSTSDYLFKLGLVELWKFNKWAKSASNSRMVKTARARQWLEVRKMFQLLFHILEQWSQDSSWVWSSDHPVLQYWQ